MKKFALASGIAILLMGFYVWGSKPAGSVQKNSPNFVSGMYVKDTLPKRKDTIPHRDTMRRKDFLQ